MKTEYETRKIMTNDNPFSETFWTFGIPCKPYRGYYTPEEYGKYLRSMFPQQQGVSYAASTELKEGVNLDGTFKDEKRRV